MQETAGVAIRTGLSSDELVHHEKFVPCFAIAGEASTRWHRMSVLVCHPERSAIRALGGEQGRPSKAHHEVSRRLPKGKLACLRELIDAAQVHMMLLPK